MENFGHLVRQRHHHYVIELSTANMYQVELETLTFMEQNYVQRCIHTKSTAINLGQAGRFISYVAIFVKGVI